MNFAVIKTSGKQYKVTPGLILEVDKIEGNAGDKVSFGEVLLVSNDDKITVGMPFVNGAAVTAKIVDQVKGDKVRVAKFKAKARFHRVTGFRSMLTKIQIEDIKNSSK